MNQKTAKLLNNYATRHKRKKKEVKKWWLSLTWKEREAERKRLLEELEEEETE